METRQIGDACSFSNINKKYTWKFENAGQYEYNLLFEDHKFDELNTQLQQATLSQHIDENIKKFEILIGNICDPLFSKNTFAGTNEACTHVNASQRPWFNDESRIT